MEKFTLDKTVSSDNFRAGFTLLEVLITMVILAVALLGMATLTGSIINQNQYAGQVSAATALAQDKIEELKNLSYSSLTSSSDTDTIYTRTWTVTVDTPTSGMSSIAVTVSWNRKNGPASVTLKTLIAR
ncbi:MAG: prepilin-type N-terminal cleavage/methylation domain-containing protein [Desulfobacterales bacterium]|nr:prepilin-type N-terminal cleavage/methylation domain-containing protein [Desulfobacterales bacterium]